MTCMRVLLPAVASLSLAACDNKAILVGGLDLSIPLGPRMDMADAPAPDDLAPLPDAAPGCSEDRDCPRGVCRDGVCSPVPKRTLEFQPAQMSIAVGGHMTIVPAIVAADFDGDNKVDFIVSRCGDFPGELAFFHGNGDGTVREGKATWLGDSCPSSLIAADFNLDGQLDLFAGDAPNNSEVFLNTGGGLFSSVAFDNTNSHVFVGGDFNGDGRPDVARYVVSGNAGSIQVLAGDGKGGFKPTVASAAAADGVTIVAGDLDGDGRLDVITWYSSPQGTYQVFLGKGDGTFKSLSSQPGAHGWMALADFDRDKKLDLLLDDGVRPGKGDGTFGALVPMAGGSRLVTTVADFDGDGLLDIAALQQNASAVVLLGNGDGSFGATFTLMGLSNGRPMSADINGDGKPDLVIKGAGFESTLLEVRLNSSH